MHLSVCNSNWFCFQFRWTLLSACTCEYKTKERKKIKSLNVNNIESSSDEDSSSDDNKDSSDEDDIDNFLLKYDNDENYYPPYDHGDNYYPPFADDIHTPLAG